MDLYKGGAQGSRISLCGSWLHYFPVGVLKLGVDLLNSAKGLQTLLLSLLLLVSLLLKPNLARVDVLLHEVTHVLGDFLVAELVIFVQLNSAVELLLVVLAPFLRFHRRALSSRKSV